jgi:hypothetical protein
MSMYLNWWKMVNKIFRYIHKYGCRPNHQGAVVVILQFAIWSSADISATCLSILQDLAHINNFNHSKKQHTMDSNKENEGPSLASSNLPGTMPPLKWPRLGASADGFTAGLWLGGSSELCKCS